MANTRIKGQQVQDGGIQTADLADLNVTTAKLAPNAVTVPKLLLATDPALEDSTGLRVKVVSPVSRSASGVGLTLATNPALEDSSGLRIKEDANGGIIRTANGLQHKAFRVETSDPASPANGDSWYNSTTKRVRVYAGGASGRMQQTFFTNSANSTAIASTTAKTAFSLSATIPSDWWAVGKAIRLVGEGIYSTTGTPTLTLDLEIAGQNLLNRGIVPTVAVTNQRWYFDVTIICQATGASGEIMRGGVLYTERSSSPADTLLIPVGAGVTRTFDMTADQTFNIYGTWSASSASNTTTMFLFTAELLN